MLAKAVAVLCLAAEVAQAWQQAGVRQPEQLTASKNKVFQRHLDAKARQSMIFEHRKLPKTQSSKPLEDDAMPDWDPDSYSQSTANHTLMFAYGAYCPEDELKSWDCKWCQVVPDFEVDLVSNLDSLQAFTGYDPSYKQVVVSFRGTHTLEDWLYDLDAVTVDYPGVNGGTVHKGFYDAWQDLKPSILPSAQNLMNKYKGQQILITGHSLGAALAQISALDIFAYANSTNNAGYRRVEDFGSPRWGNMAMVDYFKSMVDTHWRLVNVHDVVPKVPPELGDTYHHTPHEVWYTSDSPLQYVICDGSGEDPNCSYKEDSVEDHLMYLNVHESCD